MHNERALLGCLYQVSKFDEFNSLILSSFLYGVLRKEPAQLKNIMRYGMQGVVICTGKVTFIKLLNWLKQLRIMRIVSN